MGYRGRDVEVTLLDNGQYLVVACDSCGGIGPKELDVVKVPNYIVGRYTARVALMEVLATGAVPRMITATVCNEPRPAGEEILAGIRDELQVCGLPDLPLAISTEKNITTRQTGLGITVLGVAGESKLRITTSKPGDWIYCLGIPKVGDEVKDDDDPEIVQGKHILGLLAVSGIHDIIPVGSQGIRREAELLARTVSGQFKPAPDAPVDINKSGGPATCLIFSCVPGTSLPDFSPTPMMKIGEI